MYVSVEWCGWGVVVIILFLPGRGMEEREYTVKPDSIRFICSAAGGICTGYRHIIW
jgi:hypothetical protein